jgi:uncharacterized protein
MLPVEGRRAVVEVVASLSRIPNVLGNHALELGSDDMAILDTHFGRMTMPMALALSVACSHRKAIPPTPTMHVTDGQKFLSSTTVQALEEKLHLYELRSKHQIYVWITDSAHGEAYPDYTFRLFNAWGIGRERFDDGVMLFIFVKDDMRWITVGYGLEVAISDKEAVHICRDIIRPLMIDGRKDEAVTHGLDAIIAHIDAWESSLK